MFTPYEFDDDSCCVRSEDPADVGRILRAIGIGIPLPTDHRRKPVVYVTIHAPLLTEEELNTNSTYTRHEPSNVQDELPF